MGYLMLLWNSKFILKIASYGHVPSLGILYLKDILDFQ